jgi:protoporphyrinogen oxidase
MGTNISHVTVIGAGLCGLTLAWKLQQAGLQTLVLEGQPQVGGLSKSKVWQGFRFEIGPDSFYTEEQPVFDEFSELLGPPGEFQSKKHRIWVENRWISYPLTPGALLKIPPSTMAQAMGEYFMLWGRHQLERPLPFVTRLPMVPKPKQPVSTELFPQYGEVLDQFLMSDYLHKIRRHPSASLRPSWSVSPDPTKAPIDSVQQMLKGLFGESKTTLRSFHDPGRGFGSIAEDMCKEIERLGGEVKTNATLRRISAPNEEVQSVDYRHQSKEHLQPTDYVFSTIPLPTLMTLLDPLPEHALIESSLDLRHHVMIFLCVLLRQSPQDEQWSSYFPEKDVPFFRVSHAVPHLPLDTQPKHQTCLVIEWILSRHHPLASASEEELFEAAIPSLQAAGFPTAPVQDLSIHREHQAVPLQHEKAMQTMRHISAYLTRIRRLRSMGQRGTFTASHLSHMLRASLDAANRLIREADRLQGQALSKNNPNAMERS